MALEGVCLLEDEKVFIVIDESSKAQDSNENLRGFELLIRDQCKKIDGIAVDIKDTRKEIVQVKDKVIELSESQRVADAKCGLLHSDIDRRLEKVEEKSEVTKDTRIKWGGIITATSAILGGLVVLIGVGYTIMQIVQVLKK